MFCSHLMRINCLTTFTRDGLANFLIKTHSKISDFIINLGTLERRVHVLILAPRISSSSTSPALTLLPSTIVIATNTRCQRGTNCFVRDGFLQHSLVRKQSSRSIVLKRSTNLPFKERHASTIIITLCCGDLIMQISLIQS